MDLNLQGKRVVVTGAGNGIGLAVVRALAAEGARVTAGARRVSDELRRLAGEHPVLPVAVDLSTPDGPAELIDAAATAFGGLDVLVNNAGTARPRTSGFQSVTDLDWLSMLETGFLSAVRATREALPLLLEAGSGAVVTVSSVHAALPDPMLIDYSAAQAALASFSKSLSKELGPRAIRVNTVCPGPLTTDLRLDEDEVAAPLAHLNGGSAGAAAKKAARESATGRCTRPEEVADLVLLLASERSANVTGSDFVIDGGLTGTV
ncbi:SDR family NAD(P)-dependent oxidoreductase [Streptomyces fuscichromogenes]|uniref:3-oxoacyl-ACP reductase n=1 Tax=Streptomyces fuscichromogenes TaxID=1324013 RepID=A0A917X8H5_9ACTN|nr:SDR family oxidoreductase [Streptomyces fuscichromogenes]GGM97097.1 3-oxoacyl-ACP reductase [Streptomyces fuscichromogenes]